MKTYTVLIEYKNKNNDTCTVESTIESTSAHNAYMTIINRNEIQTDSILNMVSAEGC